jgi:hypothetical protein
MADGIYPVMKEVEAPESEAVIDSPFTESQLQ